MMTSGDDTVDAKLLEIARELLEASEGCAEHDPGMAEVFAREAYEIGRNIGAVQQLVKEGKGRNGGTRPRPLAVAPLEHDRKPSASHHDRKPAASHDDDDGEILIRMLDRQRHLVPAEPMPVRAQSGGRRWWRW